MRTACALLTLAGLASLAGCEGDQRAQKFARDLHGVLTRYQQEVDRKIQAEQDSYRKLAELYARAEQEAALEALGLERRERAAREADALIGAAAVQPSRPAASVARLQDALRDYAALDFDRTEKMLREGQAAQAQFLASLEDLQAESQRLAALGRLLEALGQPRKPAGQFTELAAFAGQVAELLRTPEKKGSEK